ncbi:MAG: CopG family transcriptional regulator [Halanaeroarchaeum sp.]
MEGHIRVACDEELHRRVSVLARRYDTTEAEIARQLMEHGIECLD